MRARSKQLHIMLPAACGYLLAAWKDPKTLTAKPKCNYADYNMAEPRVRDLGKGCAAFFTD